MIYYCKRAPIRFEWRLTCAPLWKPLRQCDDFFFLFFFSFQSCVRQPSKRSSGTLYWTETTLLHIHTHTHFEADGSQMHSAPLWKWKALRSFPALLRAASPFFWISLCDVMSEPSSNAPPPPPSSIRSLSVPNCNQTFALESLPKTQQEYKEMLRSLYYLVLNLGFVFSLFFMESYLGSWMKNIHRTSSSVPVSVFDQVFCISRHLNKAVNF